MARGQRCFGLTRAQGGIISSAGLLGAAYNAKKWNEWENGV